MSANKSQRTKGNVKPSSSSRATEFLQQGGQLKFIGFTGLAGNTCGYVPHKADNSELDGDLRMLLRKMTKRDTVTKLRAVQEFTTLCKDTTRQNMENIITFWPRIYNKLANDFDHRVREAVQQAHHQITTKVGRSLAPHLKHIIVCWLMSKFDTYEPSATTATLSFNEVFPDEKKKEVVLFCKTEILEALNHNFLEETQDTLSDPKTVPIEEREAKYIRFISSSFLMLKFFLESINGKLNDEDCRKLDNVFRDKKFWKFSKHNSALVRRSFYTMTSCCCKKKPDSLKDVIQLLSPAILTHFDEQEPIVVKPMWDAVLISLSTHPAMWNSVNIQKAVLPNFWKLLKNGGFGNIHVVYPNLLPFLSKIPSELTSSGIWFYEEFFNNLLTGLHAKEDNISASDITSIMSAYMECMQYILSSQQNNEKLINYLLDTQLMSVLQETFHNSKRHIWFGIFYKELNSFLMSICRHAESQSEFYVNVHERLWKIISKIFIDDSSGKLTFKSESQVFHDSLIDFLFCIIKHEVSINTDLISVNENLCFEFQGLLFTFVCSVISCFKNCISTHAMTSTRDHLADLLTITTNIELWKRLFEDLASEQTLSTNVSVCIAIEVALMQPMLDTDNNSKAIKLIIGAAQLLNKGDVQEYLQSAFEINSSQHSHQLLLLAEAFKYQHVHDIKHWLASNFVQTMVLSLCSSKNIDGTKDTQVLQFQLLEGYISILQGKPVAMVEYMKNLFGIINDHFKQPSDEKEDRYLEEAILRCFSTASKKYCKFNETIAAVADASVGVFKSSFFDCEILKRLAIESIIGCMLHDVHVLDLFTNEVITMSFTEELKINSMYHTFATFFVLLNQHSLSAFTKMFTDFLSRFDKELNCKKNPAPSVAIFYLKFLLQIQSEDKDILKDFELNVITNLLTCCDLRLSSCMPNDAGIKDLFGELLVNCSFFAKPLLASVFNEVLSGGSNDVKTYLEIFKKKNILSDDLLDFCVSLSTPQFEDSVEDKKINTFCMVLDYVTDISCVRALVEKFVDVLQNNGDTKNDCEQFRLLLKALGASISRWYAVNSISSCSQDFSDTLESILDDILVWRADHSDLLLSSLTQDLSASVIQLNAELMAIFDLFTRTSSRCFRSEHWDFILCSMVSWLQTCEESFGRENLNTGIFYSNAFHMYATLATVLCGLTSSQNTLDIIEPEVKIGFFDYIVPLFTPVGDLINEWNEFFQPSASKSLLKIFFNVLDKDKLTDENESTVYNLCCCLCFVSTDCLKELLFTKSDDKKTHKISLKKFLEKSCRLLYDGQWFVKIAVYRLLSRLSGLIEELLCEETEETMEAEPHRAFPHLLIQVMEKSRGELLLTVAASEASVDLPLEEFFNKDAKTSLLTYLLSWLLMLDIFKMALPDRRVKFANFYHHNNYVNDLLSFLFVLQSINPEAASSDLIKVCSLDYKELQNLSIHLLVTSMKYIPALIRFWFNNYANRKDSLHVDRFVTSYISPVLLKNEFLKLDLSSKVFDNMVIKTRPVAREVVAVYTVDEISMELVVKLSANHPLSPLSVECGKRIGVSNQLWRQWMLQLNTFLSFQNGSILDGLTLWKKNVDKRFEGVEECMVCFSVIHGSNYSLPSIACKTCKKKFHPVCLYTWFNKSGKSTCPLCRNSF